MKQVRSEICKLVNSGSDYDNHLLSEEHLSKLAVATQRRSKTRCAKCNKEFSENVHETIHVCRNCLTSFDTEYRLIMNQSIYLTNEPCIMKFPKEDWLSFKPKTIRFLFLLEFMLTLSV